MSETSQPAEFMLGQGDVARLLPSYDWTQSALGPIEYWPSELRALLRLMFDVPHPAFIAWGHELEVIYNDSYASLLGAKHPQALGKHLDSDHHNLAAAMQANWQRVLDGHSLNVEDIATVVYRHDYAEQAWFTFSCAPIRLGDGGIGGLYCTVIETTDKVLAIQRQAFQLELADHLRTLTSPTDIIASACQMLGNYLDVDRVWYAEVDDRARTFVTKNMWTSRRLPELPATGAIDDYGPVLVDTLLGARPFVVPSIDSDPYIGRWSEQYKLLEIGSILIIPLIKGDRLTTNLNLSCVSQHHWSAHEIALASQVAEYIWAMVERALAEQAQQESANRYRALIDIVDEGFAIIELEYDQSGAPVDYRFLEVNPAFEKQSGMSNVLGRTIKELAPDVEGFWLKLFARVGLTGQPHRVEHRAQSTGKWYNLYASPLEPSNRQRIALLFNDVTDRKQSEETLRRIATELSESDRQKTNFLATLAHELRNPLAPLRSGLEVLRLSGSNAAVIARVSDMMGRQIGHMVRLIDDLLDIARINSGKIEFKKELTSIQEVVARALEANLAQIDAHRHQLQVQMPEIPILLQMDPVRMQQALSNLLGNAVKYTPDGGHMELLVELEDGAVELRVSDDGIGIPEDELPYVFNMYAQVGKNLERSKGGLGIGLAIVNRIVEAHGGTVSATSAGPGKGSMFSIRLPKPEFVDAIGTLGTTNGRGEGRAAAARSLNIVLADDNVDAAETLGTLLRHAGHQVSIAHDGKQALHLINFKRPDVAILDIGMPEMTGHDVAQSVKKVPALAAVHLVALTGWGAAEDRTRTKDSGFDFHLTKPVELSALDEVLSRASDTSR